MTTDNVTAKIQKLLALAESSNEHEASLAAERAQELMLKYGIELAQIAARTDGTVGVRYERLRGRTDPWRRALAADVAEAMGGRLLHRQDYRKWTGEFEFWGPQGSTAGMVALYQYLEAQLVVLSAQATAQRAGHERQTNGMKWRKSWLLGATRRVGRRLLDRRAAIETQADNSTALVRVTDAVVSAINEKYAGSLRKSAKYSGDVDPWAAAAGDEAGRNVDFNDEELRGQRAALTGGHRA